MKKFMTKIVSNVINYTLLALLLFAVFTGSISLVGVLAAVYWVMISLCFVIGPLFYILSYAAKSAKDEESRRKALELVGDVAKKKNVLLRALGWLELIIISCSLAYAGWVFTAVCYFLSSLYLRLFISMARDNVAAVKLNDKEVA
ncbi:TPA: hypothetical protein M5978_003175 [Enterobacter cloacae]|uniref:hypothetical protein n=1 Tax=Enterobacter cloacae TaxID=550 RepID=UPI00296C64DD|nr:hypothetical protein [Enterobacter cloacae]HAV2288684.1 hypothetical protein [Enterobacter cloacae]HAV2320901.1 hypothetical protein [Enterobacter cloacae]HCC6151884.1 hypothetical protein [Enterobacter cloacae]HCC7649771.1 hypothetical protein [Enterobacter cloacae]